MGRVSSISSIFLLLIFWDPTPPRTKFKRLSTGINLYSSSRYFAVALARRVKPGLIGKATDLETALQEKGRLYFVEHRHGNAFAKANGVTFGGGVPAEHEVYFAIADSNFVHS
jgi:hypothetical protein